MTKITELLQKDVLTTEAVTVVSDRALEGVGEFKSYKYPLGGFQQQIDDAIGEFQEEIDDLIGTSAVNLQFTFVTLSAGTTDIPASYTSIRTSAHSAATLAAAVALGDPSLAGAAWHRYFSTVDAAYVTANPYSSFLSLDGRGWRLAEPEPDLSQWGVVYGSSFPSFGVRVANAQRVQAAFDSGLPMRLKGIIWLDQTMIPIRTFKIGTGATLVNKITGIGSANCGFLCSTDDTIYWPVFSLPEGYVSSFDNGLYDLDHNLLPSSGGMGPPTRQLLWEGFKVVATYGKYSQCLYHQNGIMDEINDVLFNSTMRGFTNWSFNTTLINCRFDGLWRFSSRTTQQCDEEFEQGWGLRSDNHTVILNPSGNGYGTILSLSGSGTTVDGARLEVAECGLQIGGLNLGWDTWNGSAFVPSTRGFTGAVHNIATESNRWGGRIVACSNASFFNTIITGSAGAVPGGRNPGAGLVVYSGAATNTIFTNTVNGVSGSDYGGIVNFSYSASFHNSAGDEIQGLNATFSGSNYDPVAHTRTTFNPAANADNTDERRYRTYDSQMVHSSLTALDLRGEYVPGRNLAIAFAVPSGATTVDITFSTSKTAGIAGWGVAPVAQADASGVLSGVYYYATSVVGAEGETGITDLDPMPVAQPGSFISSANYNRVTLTLLQKAHMTFSSAGDQYRRRVYRGRKAGYFEGYFEMAGTTTTFDDNGTVAFTGARGQPVSGGGTIRDQREIDTNYFAVVTPTWTTIPAVPDAQKTTTGFRVTFDPAAPADTVCGALLFRPPVIL